MATELDKIRNFIDGQFVEPVGGKYLDNIEPATGKPYSKVADSDGRDVELAVAAAEKAFVEWSRTPASERSRILLRVADLIERDLEKLARLGHGSVAAGEGGRNFPAQQVERQVPGRNQSRDAARLTQGVIERDAVGDVRFGFGMQDRGGEEAEIACGPRDIETAGE